MSKGSSSSGKGETRRNNLLGWLVHQATVTSVAQATRRMRVIRLTGPDLVGISWTPGQHVRVQVAPVFSKRSVSSGFRDALRTYSAWDADTARGHIELCVFDHPSDGPGARWGRSVRPGATVRFIGPEGKLVARPAAHHLFVGDETAAVAFRAIIERGLTTNHTVRGVIEVDAKSDVPDFPGSADLTWVPRAGILAPATESVVQAVRALDLPREPGSAYLAGEARTIQVVRQHLVAERGWPRRNVLTKPFWAPGKTGLD